MLRSFAATIILGLILWSQIWAFSFLHLKKRFETERPSFDIGFFKNTTMYFLKVVLYHLSFSLQLECNIIVMQSLFHAPLTSYHTLKEIIKAKRSETEKIRLETVKRKIFG